MRTLIDIANLSVRLSVCLSVRYVPVLYDNSEAQKIIDFIKETRFYKQL